MKRTEDSLRDLWGNIKCTNIQLQGSQKKKRKEEKKKKRYEKNFKEIIVLNFPSMEQERVNHIQEARIVPLQDKPMEKHAKTHTNQHNKD